MPPIRNSCVARGRLTAPGFSTVYTVPQSTVLLLKDIHLYNNSGVTANLQPILQAADGSAVVYFTQLAIPNNTGSGWAGWIAVNAGDLLVFDSDQGSVAYWISGALLPHIPGV